MELYQSGQGKTRAAGEIIESLGITADPRMQGFVAVMALAINVLCICVIIKRAIKIGGNPYSNAVFKGTKDYEEAMARVQVQ